MPDMQTHWVRATVAGAVQSRIARSGRAFAEIAEAAGLSQEVLAHRLRAESAFTIDELSSIAALLGEDVAAFLPPRGDGAAGGPRRTDG